MTESEPERDALEAIARELHWSFDYPEELQVNVYNTRGDSIRMVVYADDGTGRERTWELVSPSESEVEVTRWDERSEPAEPPEAGPTA